MSTPPLLQISDLTLSFGGNPLLDRVDLVIRPEDRIALVGRNGSGKSTLMKIMAGLVEPDTGGRTVPKGISVSYMEQDPDLSRHDTLGEFATAGLGPTELWRVEAAADGLDFDPDRPVGIASGGERRRAALARLLATSADILLLDEPTNHLDIRAIGWLEHTLKESRSTFVMISHDRAILRNLTNATLWVDRGSVRRRNAGFEGFEDWRDKIWDEEDLARHKLDRKILAEGRWAVEGISARRKRNQGRLRALQEMRATRSAQIRRQGNAALDLDSGAQSGKRVIEARGISKSFGDSTICRNLDLRVLRGDRIALVGPNGAGKTTVLEMLIGRLAPDSGTITLGTGLEIAVFDQKRAALDPDATLWDSLTVDPDMRVQGRTDQVMVRGSPRHVVGYLKDFLFDEAQARAPVGSLSGGERARLLLARLMAKPSNLLVLDEPTNDLDVETLDLLQELLDGFDGTVLLVSHDRDFLDRVATETLWFEGAGRIVRYAGGWSDAVSQRGSERDVAPPAGRKERASVTSITPRSKKASPKGLSFTERHRLDTLPAEIDRLSSEIDKLEALLGDPQLFSREPAKFAKASSALSERLEKRTAAEEEWLSLAERSEGDS